MIQGVKSANVLVISQKRKKSRLVSAPPQNTEFEGLPSSVHRGRLLETRGLITHNKKGSHPLKGVSWCEVVGKWRASIREQGKSVVLGYWKDPKKAHEAYKEAAIRIHGEFACVA